MGCVVVQHEHVFQVLLTAKLDTDIVSARGPDVFIAGDDVSVGEAIREFLARVVAGPGVDDD